MIVNNVIHGENTFGGNLTFKRRNEWISEIDLCVAKENSLILIKDLTVKQDVSGSDHAPICVTLDLARGVCASAKELITRSLRLGNSCYQQPAERKLRKSSTAHQTLVATLM